MPVNPREFHRPASFDQALELLQRPAQRTRALMPGPRVPDEPFVDVEAAVDLGLLGLDRIEVGVGGFLSLGALASLQAVATHAAVLALAGGILAEAAALAGGNAQRQAATIGGAVQQHLGAMAGVTRDGPPEVALALLALDARLVVRGVAGETAMPLSDYYDTGGMLAGDALLVAVRVPAQPAGARGALARVARTPKDQAIVAAAAVTAPGLVRLAVAGATPRPTRLASLEAGLTVPFTKGNLDALPAQVEALMDPRTDFRATADYRRAMAGVLARRALKGAVGIP
jgi:CO/xanthine dehydrogenase FAD-binding subunit